MVELRRQAPRSEASTGSTDRLRDRVVHLMGTAADRLASPPLQEIEILSHVATGKSNREIATELYVAIGTVKAHINNVFRKLSARNRTEAVARAREMRLID